MIHDLKVHDITEDDSHPIVTSLNLALGLVMHLIISPQYSYTSLYKPTAFIKGKTCQVYQCS